jgi:ribosomal protein S18 acetylase RimI-like enzyme
VDKHNGRVPHTEIRVATAVDDGPVADLVVDAYITGGHLTPDAGYVSVLRDTAQRRTKADVLVAELVGDGAPQLVGTVTVVRGGTTYSEFGNAADVEIRMLAVSPAHAGRGIGAALLGEAIERGRAAGAAGVALYTLDSMDAARTLYLRNGFQRVAEHDHEPVPGVELRAYRLPLLPEAPGAGRPAQPSND